MKKSKVIELVKKGKLAVHMNRKEEKDIELLKEILKEAFPDDVSPSRLVNFYHAASGCYKWDSSSNKYDLPRIKITEIEQEETFESGELVEVSYHGDKWIKETYGFTTRNGNFITEDNEGRISSWNYIRKINPAIEQIREIMKKNNISKEEI